MVSEVLTLSLNDSFWVVAEIASLNEHINGHCYMELVEKDISEGATKTNTGGKFRAQARANVWRTQWAQLAPKFLRATGLHLTAGMKVLLEVKVTFHEVYGYALNVSDIDATYTLGDMARRRQEILQQLDDDGVLTLNKELPLPRPLQRIAVISAAGAAGYGDFCNQLDESGFRFATRLFPATLQGQHVESSVIKALDAIAAEAEAWDCVVIIRGGGAVADLNGFETYLLAANVAQFPLPILTGIGHERDDTVIDLVAHTRLKTPTAVAQYLIDNMRAELEEVEDYANRLNNVVAALLINRRQAFDAIARRFERTATTFTSRQREHLLRISGRLEVNTRQQLDRQQHRLSVITQQILPAAQRAIERQHHRLDIIEHTLKMAGPERILNMGYSLTTDVEGRVICSASEVTPGTILKTRLADGIITSQALI